VPTRIRSRTRATRFAVAVGLVLCATLARAALDPLLGDTAPFAFNFVAVVVSSWSAGLEAGVVAAATSALIIDFLFMPPRYSLILRLPAHLGGVAVFTAIALCLAWLTSRWSAAEQAVVQSHEALASSERRFKALMNASTESIWLVDRQRVLLANATAASRIGMPLEQLQGAAWRTLFPPSVAEERGKRVDEVFSTAQPVQFEDERRNIRFEHHFYPAFGPGGEVVAVAAFSRDVTKQRRAEAELLEMAQRLAYHVENSPLAVIEFGPDMRVTRWTGSAERIFGWTAEEVLGKRMDEFRWVHDDDAAHVQVVSEHLQTGSDPWRFSSNRNYRKDGSVVTCEWYNSALVDGSGTLRSILSLVLDVTERTRLEQELREQTQQLATANRIKDDFLATLSHELRTPLNAILGWSQILSSPGVNEERLRRGLETITRNARLQARMVEDLLDVSRIVTGSVRLSMQRFDLRPIAEQALDGVRPAAEAKLLHVTADIEPGLTLVADQTRIQQVLWNLLSNAVKFTPTGGAVRLSAHSRADALEILVTDTGIGIPESFVPHVFDRFRQADSSPTREHGGLGLGLAIVRHIVELHGGTVSASSEGPGRGAVFTIRLPMACTATAASGHAPQRSSGFTTTNEGLLDGIRALVVDDDADAREMVATILDTVGAVVRSAASAAEALDTVASFQPDVLISDIAMPGMDGYELIRTIRASGSAHAQVASIALTAYGGLAAKESALGAGYDRYLPKPVNADHLLTAIAVVVGRSGGGALSGAAPGAGARSDDDRA
jgi:PAS domain S-box-containing protein